MKHWIVVAVVVGVVFLVGAAVIVHQGYGKGGHTRAPVAAPSITIKKLSFTPELALTPAEREQGLSGRTNVADNSGMLFVFPQAKLYGFWMKDMLLPIDMIWIGAQGQVVTVKSDVSTTTYPSVLYPSAPALYVLETRAGFAKAHGIVLGSMLDLKNIPSVSE